MRENLYVLDLVQFCTAAPQRREVQESAYTIQGLPRGVQTTDRGI